jgi:preprotein translocase subunit SecY
MPSQLTGGHNLGFMFLPNYRGWVVVLSLIVCLTTWFVIDVSPSMAFGTAERLKSFGMTVIGVRRTASGAATSTVSGSCSCSGPSSFRWECC